MSSHELRNPLSGVWQNAEVIGVSLEGISSLLDDIHAGKPLDRRLLDTARREMRENAESVESIILCASHQGRIADGEQQISRIVPRAKLTRILVRRHPQRQQAQHGSLDSDTSTVRAHRQDERGDAHVRSRVSTEEDRPSSRRWRVDLRPWSSLGHSRRFSFVTNSSQLPLQRDQGALACLCCSLVFADAVRDSHSTPPTRSDVPSSSNSTPTLTRHLNDPMRIESRNPTSWTSTLEAFGSWWDVKIRARDSVKKNSTGCLRGSVRPTPSQISMADLVSGCTCRRSWCRCITVSSRFRRRSEL